MSLPRSVRRARMIERAENYGYWLAIKHVVLGLAGITVAYVTWHIPA